MQPRKLFSRDRGTPELADNNAPRIFSGRARPQRSLPYQPSDGTVGPNLAARAPNRNSPLKLISAGLVLIALAGSGYYAYQFLDSGAEVEVVTVQQGTLSKLVNGFGNVVSRKQVDLTATVAGQIMTVQVRDGAKVKKGELLASMDQRQAKIAVKRAEAALLKAQSDVALAERSLQQISRSARGGEIPQTAIGDMDTEVRATKARQQVAEEELNAAQLALERLRITAPFDGQITQLFAVEGMWIEPPAPLFTIVDMSQLEAAVRIDPVDARDVIPGQQVSVSSSAFPTKEWTETISRLAPAASSAGTDYATVYVSLNSGPEGLHYGNKVEAQIATQSTSKAIKLPYEAILTQDKKDVIAVVEFDRVHFRPVTLGIQAVTEVEIKDGVKVGETVVLPRTQLSEGQKVQASNVTVSKLDDEGFPFRTDFSDVTVYGADELRKAYNDVLIVDVRSKFEYDVAHVAKAANIPIASDSFTQDLAKLRAKDAAQPIVFYCNGHTCKKSYQAARKAMQDGFKNIVAYDGGIFDWMATNRDKTTLLEATPAPLNKMVSNEYFLARLVDFKKFQKLAKGKNALIIDIRDDMQRKTELPDLSTIELPLDRLISKLNAGQFKEKQLLIFDASGHQTRWLQYVLEDHGYKDYFFLKGGILAVTGETAKK